MNRRNAIKHLAGAAFFARGLATWSQCYSCERTRARLTVSYFSADITPPIGSPLLGGLVQPVHDIVDKLQAKGIVLYGADKPIVLCAIDWSETHNSAYDMWRQALAEAAGTHPSYVALQSMHAHDTPLADLEANTLLQKVEPSLSITDVGFFHEALRRTASALKESLKSPETVTHVGVGKGRVEKVASTRRLLGSDGKVAIIRYSHASSEKARNAPEGLIDAYLRTVSLWNEDKPIIAMHYYAVHPISYYGQGHVTCDFCGLARDLRQSECLDVFQIYFTGCAGDIAAGKYNDGSKDNRAVLRDRVYAGMVAAWDNTLTEPLMAAPHWKTVSLKLPARTEKEFDEGLLKRTLADSHEKKSQRLAAAMKLAWQSRKDRPVELSCLSLGRARILHLPGEPFVAYQLYAQKCSPNDFVCVAGYGDGGMGYIPLHDSYEQGGYEPTWSFVGPDSEALLKNAIADLLESKTTSTSGAQFF